MNFLTIRDGLLRLHALGPLGFEREVYQHDRILLDDADEQDDPDQRDHAEVEMEGHEHEQCAETG
jgi:hypothetical protein